MIIKHGGHIHEVRKDMWAFFLDCALRMLIGWADKLRSRGKYIVADYAVKTLDQWNFNSVNICYFIVFVVLILVLAYSYSYYS